MHASTSHQLLKASFLQNQITLYFISWFRSHMVNLALIMITKGIKTQAVACGIDDMLQFVTQHFVLRIIKNAFKHGILHPRAMRNAQLGYLTKSSPARGGRGIYIIGN